MSLNKIAFFDIINDNMPIIASFNSCDIGISSGLVSKCGYLGDIQIDLDNEKVTDKVDTIKSLCTLQSVILTGLKVNSNDDDLVTPLLDNGLRIAFFDYDENTNIDNQLELFKTFPKERIGIRFNTTTTTTIKENIIDIFNQFKSVCSNICITSNNNIDNNCNEIEEYTNLFVNHAKEKENERNNYFLHLSTAKASSYDIICSNTNRHHNVFVTVSPVLYETDESGSSLLDEDKGHTVIGTKDAVDILGVYISCLRTDRPDGLYTTVVCDEMGVCLGLVYSNKQSIRHSIISGRGTYWSRSRGGLWKKGETSGAIQSLIDIAYDCDGDALRYRVIQQGNPPAFCHLNTRTCWGEARGLQHLQSTLQSRLANAPTGSYTKRLFDDPSLLRKKLLEEVQELVEAEESDHIAAEAADVTYFMMVRCIAGGVGLSDIERHLDKRSVKVSRRPGNAKAWRTADAEKTLSDK